MIEIENINIKKSILHILDTEASIPVISTESLEMTTEMLVFLTKHIYKQMNSLNVKQSNFNDDSRFKALMENFSEENFYHTTKNIAEVTFDFMNEQPDIPSSDNVYLHGDIDGRPFFAMLKYDYKVSYCHQIVQDNDIVNNQIIKHVRTIANESQKSDAFYLIFLDNFDLRIVEKIRLIDGKKTNYLSEIILQAHQKISEGKKQDVLDKVCKKIVEDRYQNHPGKYAQIKNQLIESIDEEDQTIQIDDFVESVPFTTEEKKYLAQELEGQGIDKHIVVNKAIEKKITKKQKIMTDLGIEITFPEDFIHQQDMFEFSNNEDGTINITIKSIKHFKSK